MSFLPSRNQSLPVSQPDPASDEQPQGLRRRLSSLSLQIQPSSSPAYAWALHRSKSLSSMGESAGNSLKKWWQVGWGWILSHKPAFATDLELNGDDEKHFVGTHNRGTWRHVFYKIRAEFRRIIGSHGDGLPVTFRYDSKDYAKNFDDSVLRRSATLH